MNHIISARIKAKAGQLLLSTILLLGFVCTISQTTHAQALQPPSQSYQWKSAEEANGILLAQITVLNEQIPGLTAGTPLYDNTLRRIAYFKAILEETRKGADLAQALELAIPAAATLGFEKEASYTPRVILRALQTETRVMLTN
ncbi:MAG: hypothetical protein IT261_12085 [Saprospiraceae bacterium]|nr:hypothetical protein [Saprospiraceae bacterium]